EATREELEIEEYVFKQFGIIPTDYDFAECIRPAFFRQASAFYSPRRKEVILPAWSPTPTQTLIHEAVHVLQDQQLDLAENDALRGFFHDRSLASGALLEGDARMITRQILQKYPYINDDRPTQPFETLPIPDPKCSFPHSLTRLFDFQYEGGLTYWQKLNERYPNASRKEVLRLFPTQTSIILQPEKTFEAPTDEICRGTKGEYARSLGVAMIQEALMTMVPEKRAMSIASDLSFDCYHATAKKVLWTSTWETTQSLTEFLYFVRRMKELSPTLFEGKFSREGVTLTFYGEKAAVSPQVR
ncbi:MAG: hypothetical protein KDD70_03170, partial [Bdellovibrionales bacterium]|nr:hypothetical protein [Bdellovibrionales bacterium]